MTVWEVDWGVGAWLRGVVRPKPLAEPRIPARIPVREGAYVPATLLSTAMNLGIAFGGGGMRGWAHLGVLTVLDRLGLRPDVLAGCSAGALIGAYRAAGFTVDEMAALMREQKTSSLFSLRFDGVGLLSQDNFRAYLRRHLGDVRLEDLATPLYVVATDLDTGREVVLSRGSVVDAVLASSAMPGIFAPVEVDGRLLVDGGLCNNVPVSALVHAGARGTVGVRLHNREHLTPMRKARADADGGEGRVSLALWAERLAQRFAVRGGLPGGLEVASRALDIVTAQIEQARLQTYPPDVLLTPDLARVGVLSFSEDKAGIFESGVRAAEDRRADLLALGARLRGGDGRAGAPPDAAPRAFPLRS